MHEKVENENENEEEEEEEEEDGCSPESQRRENKRMKKAGLCSCEYAGTYMHILTHSLNRVKYKHIYK